MPTGMGQTRQPGGVPESHSRLPTVSTWDVGLTPMCRADRGERGTPDAPWLSGAASASPGTFLPPRAALGGKASRTPHPTAGAPWRWQGMVSPSISPPAPQGTPRHSCSPPRQQQLPALLQGSVPLLLPPPRGEGCHPGVWSTNCEKKREAE